MGIKIDFDGASMAGYLGSVQGICDALETDINIRRVVRGVNERLVWHFDNDLCRVALTAPERQNDQGAWRNPYEHVFEPGYIGVNEGWAKLWMHVSSGVGRNRIAGFVFRDSVMPLEEPTSANTGLPEEVVEKLRPKQYVFEKRARIEEAGLATVLRPNPSYEPASKKLVVPGTNNKGFYFADVFTYNRNRSPMRGQFVTFWTTWWATQANRIYKEQILPELDAYVRAAAEKAGRAAVRTRKKTKSFSVAADTSREAAELMMQAEMTGWEKYVVDGEELAIFD